MSDQELLEKTAAMRNGELKMKREGCYWSPEEDALVEHKYYDLYETITQIAIEQERTESAIIQRISNLAAERCGNQKRPNQKKSKLTMPSGCLCADCKADKALCPLCVHYQKKGGSLMFESYMDVMTVDEVCEALRMGYNAVYELVQSGKLKAYKNGRVWRIPRESVRQFVLENTRL